MAPDIGKNPLAEKGEVLLVAIETGFSCGNGIAEILHFLGTVGPEQVLVVSREAVDAQSFKPGSKPGFN